MFSKHSEYLDYPRGLLSALFCSDLILLQDVNSQTSASLDNVALRDVADNGERSMICSVLVNTFTFHTRVYRVPNLIPHNALQPLIR